MNVQTVQIEICVSGQLQGISCSSHALMTLTHRKLLNGFLEFKNLL